MIQLKLPCVCVCVCVLARCPCRTINHVKLAASVSPLHDLNEISSVSTELAARSTALDQCLGFFF